MEAFLLGDDDDNSDDDNGGGLEGLAANSNANSISNMAPPVSAAAASPAPSDLAAKLKSLYAPANKSLLPQSPSQAAGASSMQSQQLMQHQHQHHGQNQQQRIPEPQIQQNQQQPPPFQRMPSQPPQQQLQQRGSSQEPQMQRMSSEGSASQIMRQQRMPMNPVGMQPQQRQSSTAPGAAMSPMPPLQHNRPPPPQQQPMRTLLPSRDPFEPTPLTNMMPRQQSSSSTHGQQQHRQHHSQQPSPQQQQQHHHSQPIQQQPPYHSQQSHNSQLQQQQQHHIQQPQQPMAQPVLSLLQEPVHRSTSSASSIATVRASNVNPLASHATHHSLSSTHHAPSSSHRHQALSSSSSVSRHHDRAQTEHDAKKVKEQFLMFTRVLMKYLEQKDPQMHARAKAVIRECAEKNRQQEKGYESVTASMNKRLRATVGDQYWKRAESYLVHFQDLQRKKKAASAAAAPTSAVSSSQQQAVAQQQQRQQQQATAVLAQQQAAAAAAAAQTNQSQAAADAARRIQELKKEKDREARERMEEIDKQRRAKLMAQQEEQKKNAEKQRQHAFSAAKQQQVRETTAAQLSALKAHTNKQRAAALAATNTSDSKQAITTKPQGKRKNSTSSVGSVSGPSSRIPVPAVPMPELPPREHNELMEMIDHAVDYDWTTAGLLQVSKADIELNTDQHKLLYGMAAPKPSTDNRIRRGWTDRNIVTTRAAWAKVRLRETVLEKQAGVQQPRRAWFNEDRAESDPVLAIMSEATQMFLKQVLEKALQCARQRENLEGIRLWHLQHSGSKPPMGIRLGCDVTRQVALAAGNSCRTVQRLEEALERRPAPIASNLEEQLSSVTSMGDLACRPKLALACERADYRAKRCFEVSGGKDSSAPPFGRAPKQAKIMAHDCQMGMELSSFPNPRQLTLHFV